MKKLIKVFSYSFLGVISIFFTNNIIYAIDFRFEIPPSYTRNTKEGTPIIEQNKTVRVYIHITKDDDNDIHSILTLKNLNNGKVLKDNLPFNLAKRYEDVIWSDFKISELGPQKVQAILIDNEDDENILGEDTFQLISDIDTDNDGVFNTEDSDDDGDGLTDMEETLFGSNTLLPDSDFDGLDDSQELDLKLNPNKKDTDGDGVHDNFDAFPLNPKLYLNIDSPKFKNPENKKLNSSQKKFKNKTENKSVLTPQNNLKNKFFLLQDFALNNNLNDNNIYEQENSSKFVLKKYLIKGDSKIFLKNILNIKVLNLTDVFWSINDQPFSNTEFLEINSNLPFQNINIKILGFDKNLKPKNFNFNIWILSIPFYYFLIFILLCILFIIFGLISRDFRKRRKKTVKK